jgi:hypothetical protein
VSGRQTRVLALARMLAGTATVVLLLALLAGCGSSSSSTSNRSSSASGATAGTATGGSTGEAVTRKRQGHRCIRASTALIRAIELGLNGKGGKTLTFAYAVKSNDTFPMAPSNLRGHIYFVTGYVLNRAHRPDVATWVTGKLSGHGLIYPASGLANDATTFKNIGGSSSKPKALAFGVVQTSDGFSASGVCSEDAHSGH